MTTINSSTVTETAAYAVTYANASSVHARRCGRCVGCWWCLVRRGRRLASATATPRETWGSTTTVRGVVAGCDGVVGGAVEGPGSQ